MNPDCESIIKNIDQRREILNTALPVKIIAGIKGRSRVRVKSLGDLRLYMNIIEPLIEQYKDYDDHEQAICELLSISMTTFHEWRRLFKKANKAMIYHENIAKAYYDDDMSIKEFKMLLNNET